MLIYDDKVLQTKNNINIVLVNEHLYSRWVNWIKLISKQHEKYSVIYYIKEHFLKHLNECLEIKKLNINDLNFCNKLNSLINLFYIYSHCFYKNQDLKFIVSKHYNIDIENLRYIKTIQLIFNMVKKTECNPSDEKNYTNIRLLQNIFNLILKICIYYEFPVDYSQLIERLIIFQNKRNQAFNVHENGEVSIL